MGLKDYAPMLAEFRHPNKLSSIWQLTTTLTLYFASWFAMYWCLSISYWLTLLLAVPTALLTVRLFIIQHDCGHRSFFKSKRANDLVGSLLGILTCTPYHNWRREHALHHATSGDLERRGKSGEIWTLTVEEYRQAHWLLRLKYRLYRNPLILFVFGAPYHFVIHQRLTYLIPKTWKRERRGVHLNNLGLLLAFAGISLLIGPLYTLIIQLPVMTIAATVGVWLFYVQHQYEDAFWEREDWDYVDAAIAGSSYYRLPKILQWFTGNIGLHHIHHLDSKIPNYHLQKCHNENPAFHEVTQFSLRESIPCMFLKLWDEEQGKMVGFDAV